MLSTIILGILGIMGIWFAIHFVKAIQEEKPKMDRFAHLSAVGFVTNFFDTLGIGCFAPATAWFRAANLVKDRIIPGTLNVGFTITVIIMAFYIYR